ncbi:endonuclease domain-containing 1 protein-like [Anabas testudineus]|uniref:Endonuclease domain-containing 1 protein-like n=1 Tax=Anabas testudineus TaxID=64144 RepID=A0A3Q1INJ1_ANATE|nr:endonuclease domain-containing 1 protein-like [Anabas testudineus]
MVTPLKMWCFLPLAVLLLSITPTETKVVNEMSECEGFLLDETPPQVPGILENGGIMNQNRYKIICQTYRDEKRFVTLYDTKNKIPVFSAYKYRGGEGGEANRFWKIEPQLENMENDVNMEDCNINIEYKNQAGDNDYKTGTRYDKGHLFPLSYALNEDDKISTCTLTNAVPQVASFNQGSWRRMEGRVKCVLDNYCNSEGYLVTGAEPSKKTIMNKDVNVPSVLWSAFCCYSEKLNTWIASAHWGKNAQEEPNVKQMYTRTLEELYDKLTDKLGDKKFEAFPNTKCPLRENVAEKYPEIKQKCRIPVYVPGAIGKGGARRDGRARGIGGAGGAQGLGGARGAGGGRGVEGARGAGRGQGVGGAQGEGGARRVGGARGEGGARRKGRARGIGGAGGAQGVGGARGLGGGRGVEGE